MVSFKIGDLMTADAEALVNPVNCVGVMGKGVAAIMKKAFPYNYDVYKTACHNGQVVPGKLLSTWDSNTELGRKLIINFPTKTDWRLPSRYQYIKDGLQVLPAVAKENKIQSIAMPLLGCGYGVLRKDIVSIMIAKALLEAPFDTTVFMIDIIL